jgi:hypothetical protein
MEVGEGCPRLGVGAEASRGTNGQTQPVRYGMDRTAAHLLTAAGWTGRLAVDRRDVMAGAMECL